MLHDKPHPTQTLAAGAAFGRPAHLYAPLIEPGAGPAVLMHETVHASLEQVLGHQRFRQLALAARGLAEAGDETVLAALARIPTSTPTRLREEELLAYLVQEAVQRGLHVERRASHSALAPLTDLLRELFDALRAWWITTPLCQATRRLGLRIDPNPAGPGALGIAGGSVASHPAS